MDSVLSSVIILLTLFGNIHGQELCNFEQFVLPGWSYEIRNVGYPLRYKAGSRCRWVARSQWDQQVKITCNPFIVPSNQECGYSRLEIQDGNGPIAPFCGNRGFTYTSKSPRLTITLITYANNPRGSFRCTIEAVQPSECSCGKRNAPKIHGGEETAVHEYPFMAAIIATDTRTLICGGTIINKRQVLTAAHCVVGKLPLMFGVLVGAHNLDRVQDTPDARFLLTQSYIAHQNYNVITADYDIALITVIGEIPFNEFISPVCLSFQRSRDSFASYFTDILGWGADSFVSGPLNVLMRAKVGVTTPSTCRFAYPKSTERQICTQEPNRDSCSFDSGGPLTIQSDISRKIVQIGIINKGPRCGEGGVALNLRVGFLLDWILANSPRDTIYCESE